MVKIFCWKNRLVGKIDLEYFDGDFALWKNRLGGKIDLEYLAGKTDYLKKWTSNIRLPELWWPKNRLGVFGWAYCWWVVCCGGVVFLLATV